MDNWITLQPEEVAAGRPFSDPEHGQADRALLCQMALRLSAALEQAAAAPSRPPPIVLFATEPDGRDHRVVLAQPARLQAGGEMAVVGFFGQKRPEADPVPLETVDNQLIEEFSKHPDVLSYSSMARGDGNWCNLVVLGSTAAAEHWRTSELHAYAVSALAPGYYHSIRLHNGRLADGPRSGQSLTLIRTKYYDFSAPAIWRAVRELATPS